MITIGITGGIGSGKSVVSNVLEIMGVPVYDCDSKAKVLYDTDPVLKDEMISHFGHRLYHTPDGKINKALLAGIVFTDQAALSRVNELVHPAVDRDFLLWRDLLDNQGYKLCGIESAILFQTNIPRFTDCVIAVTAPDEIRVRRAVSRDGSSREEVQRRIAKQMSQNDIIARSDYMVVNDGDTFVVPQLYDIIKRLR